MNRIVRGRLIWRISRYTIWLTESVIEIVSEITQIETIAVGGSIREVARLRKMYGRGRWRKLKGQALVRLPDGMICKVELHRYEAHGIGKKDVKIKQILSELR